MATLKNGLFGHFSGKIGGVVGTSWKGKQVVRKLPARRKTAPTQGQLQQQARFALLIGFLKPIAPILNKAFEKSKLKMTAFNKAMSDNQKAVTGTYPNFKMDYANVSLCKGAIRNPDVMKTEASSEGKLVLSVSKSSLYSIAAIWTLFFIAAYDEESRRWIYTINPGPADNNTYELDLSRFRSKSFHTYAGFMPATGSSTISLYTGMITVQ